MSEWIETFFTVASVLSGLCFVFPLLMLPTMTIHSVWAGLAMRHHIPWEISLTDSAIEARRKGRHVHLPLATIASARMVENDNWTESTVVEDALTLRDERGKRVLKVPRSARGFEELMAWIARAGLPLERVGVGGPAFLD